MPSELIEADYEKLDQIAAVFMALSDQTTQTLGRVMSASEDIYGVHFAGEAADDFWAELNNVIKPRVTKLAEALRESSEGVSRIISILQQAEERAAQTLNSAVDGATSTSTIISGGNGNGAAVNSGTQPDSSTSSRGNELSASGRSGEQLNKVIDDTGVYQAKYMPHDGNTYCNLFAADVAKRAGAPLPLYVTDSNGNITQWLGATAMKEWLDGRLTAPGAYEQGTTAGWTKVDAATAAKAANNGYFTVAAGHGHIAVVRAGNPENVTHDSVIITQAGANNFANGKLKDGWGQYSNEAEYYVYKGK